MEEAARQSSSSRHPSLTPPPDSDSQGEQAELMSARVLRKGKARARVVDDDESDDDFRNDTIKAPPRKKATRNSTRLAEVSSSSSNVELPVEIMTTAAPPIAIPVNEDIQMEVDHPTFTSTPSEPAPSEREPSPSLPPVVKPAKVRLKLSKLSRTPTPSEPEDDVQSRESEGEGQDGRGSGESEAEDDTAIQVAAAGGPSSAAPSRTAPLTARQAALAGVAPSPAEHLSLDVVEMSRRVKAAPKTEEEIALKKREAAKRRKLQMELKVKEEKEGAVDRLLNKQAPRPRMKRTHTGTAAGTLSGYATPPVNRSTVVENEVGGDDTRSTSPDDGSASGGGANASIIPPVVPTSFRWISTTREGGGSRPLIEVVEPAEQVPDTTETMDATQADNVDVSVAPAAEPTTDSGTVIDVTAFDPSTAAAPKKEPKLQTVFFSLSIPPSIMPSPSEETRPRSIPMPHQQQQGCGVAGCDALKRYRVVLEGGEEKAACGLEHFRLLKGVAAK